MWTKPILVVKIGKNKIRRANIFVRRANLINESNGKLKIIRNSSLLGKNRTIRIIKKRIYSKFKFRNSKKLNLGIKISPLIVTFLTRKQPKLRKLNNKYTLVEYYRRVSRTNRPT